MALDHDLRITGLLFKHCRLEFIQRTVVFDHLGEASAVSSSVASISKLSR